MAVLMQPSTWWLRNRSVAGRLSALDESALQEVGGSLGSSSQAAQSSSGGMSASPARSKEPDASQFSAARLMQLANATDSDSESESDYDDIGGPGDGEPEPSLADLLGGGIDGDDAAFPSTDVLAGESNDLTGWQQDGMTLERLHALEGDRTLSFEAVSPGFFHRRTASGSGWSRAG